METQGRFDEKFKSIVDCYENQFELGLDIGSSLAITYEGEMVVDIWAGNRAVSYTHLTLPTTPYV